MGLKIFVTPAIVEIPMTFYYLIVDTVTTVSKFDIDEQSFSCNQTHAKTYCNANSQSNHR